jgi:hypothetical protein
MMNLLEQVKESRVKCTEGYYTLTLDIPERVVYSAYDEVGNEAIVEIVLSYLMCIDEEGEPTNVSIRRDLENEIFKVEMELHYCDLSV